MVVVNSMAPLPALAKIAISSLFTELTTISGAPFPVRSALSTVSGSNGITPLERLSNPPRPSPTNRWTSSGPRPIGSFCRTRASKRCARNEKQSDSHGPNRWASDGLYSAPLRFDSVSRPRTLHCMELRAGETNPRNVGGLRIYTTAVLPPTTRFHVLGGRSTTGIESRSWVDSD